MDESELIDAFLRGELEEARHQEFIKQLDANTELKRKVLLRKLVIEGIGQAYTEKLKLDLKEFDKSLDGKSRFQFSWKIAAVFAFFVMAGSVVYMSLNKTSPTDFDIADTGLPNEMGMSTNLEFTKAMNSFKAGDLKLAGTSFNALLNQNPANDTLLYYSGICAFQTNDNEQAIRNWNEISLASSFKDKAEYRLAIAYWTIGDAEKAKVILKKVSENKKHPYQKEALMALRELD